MEQPPNYDPNYIEAMRREREYQDNLVKFQLDTRDLLEQMKYDLMGYEEDPEKGGWVPSPFKKKRINAYGANAITGMMLPLCSKIISLSNMDEEEIDKDCLDLLNSFTWFLCRYKNEFEIESTVDIDVILEVCDRLARATEKKSFGGWEGDGIRKQFTINESKDTVISQPQQNKSWFTNPFPNKV